MNKTMRNDMILNIVATIIPLAALQLVILPVVNREINNAESFGGIVGIISLVTLFAKSYGISLNNVHLITQNKDADNDTCRNFNHLLLTIGPVIVAIIDIVVLLLYRDSVDTVDLLMITAFAAFSMFIDYQKVCFRIKLNYLGILINNLVLFLGYVIGFALFIYTSRWIMIYVVGSAFATVHLLIATDYWKYGCKRNATILPIIKKVAFVESSSIISGSTSYADKILLYPIMGGETVAIYYASTIFAKIASLLVSPVSNVFLSYISKRNRISRNNFASILLTGLIISIVAYGCCLALSKPIITLLYPEYAVSALNYVPITTASAMLTLIISLIDPIVLRFCNIKFQLLLSIENLLVYIVAAVILTNKLGVLGFAISIMLTYFIKLVTLIVIYIASISKQRGSSKQV